ncbi:MAG: hypothetical protein AB2A00_04910 [Myxococcota bacterium]
MKLDTARTRVTVQTWATGVLSALAHDLVITAEPQSGSVSDGDTATVIFPVRGLRVDGVLKKGAVDRGVLSASDRAKIEERIRDEVFAGAREVRVTARMPAGGAPTFTLEAGSRRASFTGRARHDGEGHVTGEVELSLAALGIAEVKGPLGAIKVKDRVLVTFDAWFTRAG